MKPIEAAPKKAKGNGRAKSDRYSTALVGRGADLALARPPDQETARTSAPADVPDVLKVLARVMIIEFELDERPGNSMPILRSKRADNSARFGGSPTRGSTPYRSACSEVSCSDPLSYGRTFVLKESTKLDSAF